MNHQQFYEQCQREQQWREEKDAKEVERANEILAEMAAARDAEFIEQLEQKFPGLKGWK